MNVLSKKDFCRTLNDLRHNDEFLNSINDVFQKFGKDYAVCSTGLEDTVVDLLEIIFQDKENQWIAYWIWEENFGETYKEGDVTENDGTIIPLRTAEELYDFLVKNMKEKVDG